VIVGTAIGIFLVELLAMIVSCVLASRVKKYNRIA
jgi:hypothetical protein